MNYFLTPIINILVAMGASEFSACIVIILFATFGGAMLGAKMDTNSALFIELGALVGFLVSTALLIDSYFPFH